MLLALFLFLCLSHAQQRTQKQTYVNSASGDLIGWNFAIVARQTAVFVNDANELYRANIGASIFSAAPVSSLDLIHDGASLSHEAATPNAGVSSLRPIRSHLHPPPVRDGTIDGMGHWIGCERTDGSGNGIGTIYLQLQVDLGGATEKEVEGHSPVRSSFSFHPLQNLVPDGSTMYFLRKQEVTRNLTRVDYYESTQNETFVDDTTVIQPALRRCWNSLDPNATSPEPVAGCGYFEAKCPLEAYPQFHDCECFYSEEARLPGASCWDPYEGGGAYVFPNADCGVPMNVTREVTTNWTVTTHFTNVTWEDNLFQYDMVNLEEVRCITCGMARVDNLADVSPSYDGQLLAFTTTSNLFRELTTLELIEGVADPGWGLKHIYMYNATSNTLDLMFQPNTTGHLKYSGVALSYDGTMLSFLHQDATMNRGFLPEGEYQVFQYNFTAASAGEEPIKQITSMVVQGQLGGCDNLQQSLLYVSSNIDGSVLALHSSYLPASFDDSVIVLERDYGEVGTCRSVAPISGSVGGVSLEPKLSLDGFHLMLRSKHDFDGGTTADFNLWWMAYMIPVTSISTLIPDAKRERERFRISMTVPQGDLVKYTWRMDNAIISNEREFYIRVNDSGDYTFRATASNDVDSRSYQTTTEIQAPILDLQLFVSHEFARIREDTVYMIANVTEGSHLTWGWSFGDAAVASASGGLESKISKIYYTPGTYTIQVSATNQFYNNLVSKVIRVKDTVCEFNSQSCSQCAEQWQTCGWCQKEKNSNDGICLLGNPVGPAEGEPRCDIDLWYHDDCPLIEDQGAQTIVGAIGAAVGVVALIVLGASIVWFRRKKRTQTAEDVLIQQGISAMQTGEIMGREDDTVTVFDPTTQSYVKVKRVREEKKKKKATGMKAVMQFDPETKQWITSDGEAVDGTFNAGGGRGFVPKSGAQVSSQHPMAGVANWDRDGPVMMAFGEGYGGFMGIDYVPDDEDYAADALTGI